VVGFGPFSLWIHKEGLCHSSEGINNDDDDDDDEIKVSVTKYTDKKYSVTELNTNVLINSCDVESAM
jgi:hypothetical protein